MSRVSLQKKRQIFLCESSSLQKRETTRLCARQMKDDDGNDSRERYGPGNGRDGGGDGGSMTGRRAERAAI